MPEPSPESAVAELADLLTPTATGDWKLVWRATLYRGGFERRLETVVPPGVPPLAEPRTGPEERRIAVERLATALTSLDDGDWHAVELTVEPGRVEAVGTSALSQDTGDLPPTYHVVVDAAPQSVDDEVAEPPAAQGDPARVVELVETYAGYRQLALRPPATEDEIAAAERAMGVTFPPDLRALYRLADGEDSDFGLFGGPTFLPLDAVVERWREREPAPSDLVTIESDPPGAIRRVTWHPRWVPFADHHDGNLFAVDMAPGPSGTAGQVVAFGRDYYVEPVRLVAGSVTDLLAELVDMLRAGDVEPGQDLAMFLDYTKADPDHSHDVSCGTQSIQDWIEALPEPAQVQELWIRDAGDIDLAPLAALSRLRVLYVYNADDVTGVEALRSCPLEQVTISAREVDLSGLDRHPTLRILDASESRVTDVGAVTRLPALRHLNLETRQWARIRDDQLPPLATATLTGVSSLGAACDWARRLVPTMPAPWRYSAAR